MMNALEMKLIALKFAIARRQVGLPNDRRFQTNSGAPDVSAITQQLSQGIVIDDRDLTVTNTIIEDCEHEANIVIREPTQNITTTEEIAPAPEVEPQTPAPEPIEHIEPTEVVQAIPEPDTQASPGLGGRIWQYFKDTTNVQPKS
jgi:hypothetical protein